MNPLLDKHQPSRILVENNTGATIPALRAVTFDASGIVYPQVVLANSAASDAGKLPMDVIKTFRFPLVMEEIAQPTNLIAYMYAKIVAATEVPVTKDILGKTLANPTTVDPDLSGGIPVL